MLEQSLSIVYIVMITLISLYAVFSVCKKYKIRERNYRGKDLWIGTGAIIPLTLLLLIPVKNALNLEENWRDVTLVSVLLGIVGLYDDRFGLKTVKGIKGHLQYFFMHKKISSGLIKVFGICFVGLMISLLLYNDFITILLSTAVFSIWTNIINLLDVRPGRAIKGVFLILLLLVVLYGNWLQIIDTLLVIWILVLFLIDVKEIGMLGDTGSNILGGIVGYWIITKCSIFAQFLFFIVGLYLTFYAEKNSFSAWIEKHPLIKKIDHWGRQI